MRYTSKKICLIEGKHTLIGATVELDERVARRYLDAGFIIEAETKQETQKPQAKQDEAKQPLSSNAKKGK